MDNSSAPTYAPQNRGKFKIAPWVFGPALVLIVGFLVLGALLPSTLETAFGAAQSWIVAAFGWYYILLVAAFVVFAFVIGFSRFGRIKLGAPDSKPEFSRPSWFAMLFSAGMGIGLVFYGVAEPITHFGNAPARSGAPEDITAASEATQVAVAEQAQHITYVHWGMHAWAIYIVVALALAYSVHRRGRPLSIRWALEPLIGERAVRGWVGNVVDVIAVVGTIFGVATSLGLGAAQINAGFDFLGIFGASTGAAVGIIVVITFIALASVLSGIGRGIKWLSNTNMVIAGAVLLFVFLVGPTAFIIEDFLRSIGYYLQNVVQTTFATDSWWGNDFQATWTTFYWGWWMSWAPFVGVFIARISKGRSIREFIFAVMLVPTVLTFFWFSTLGGTGLRQQIVGEGGLLGLDPEQALFQMLAGLPVAPTLSVIAVGVATLLVATFFITSSDSASLVVDMLTSGGELEPPRTTRALWALLEGAVAAVLLFAGGLIALRTGAIITALPFSVVMILMAIATVRSLRAEHQALVDAGLEPARGAVRPRREPAGTDGEEAAEQRARERVT